LRKWLESTGAFAFLLLNAVCVEMAKDEPKTLAAVDLPRALGPAPTNIPGTKTSGPLGEERVHLPLLAMGSKFGVEDSRGMLLNLPLTQKDPADLIGSSRPPVSVQLAKLSGCSALIRDGRRLILVKPRLENEAFGAVS
jgi:CRP-like cAMP-binding protein